MSSVNKVVLIGNAGRDAEIRYMDSGKAVANVSIATTSKYKNNAGETVEDTQWHRITFYDKLAEIAADYVRRGRQIYVEGRLKYGKYTDQSGVEKATVEIVANELTLLGSRDNNGDGGQQERPQQRSRGNQAPQQRQQGGQGYQERPQQRSQGNQAPQQRPQGQGGNQGYQQRPQGGNQQAQSRAPEMAGGGYDDSEIPF